MRAEYAMYRLFVLASLLGLVLLLGSPPGVFGAGPLLLAPSGQGGSGPGDSVSGSPASKGAAPTSVRGAGLDAPFASPRAATPPAVQPGFAPAAGAMAAAGPSSLEGTLSNAAGSPATLANAAGSPAAWRIRIQEAAVAPGEMDTLGDIAEVHGTPPPGVWEQLAARPLWPAPPETGKPLQINKNRLNQALRETLGSYADLCILPTSLALQRGGSVLREADLRALVVKTLTPEMRAMRGEARLDDFRLPAYAFLAHAGQSVELEPVKLNPGRLSLRFLVREVDGSAVRRFTGTVLLEQWVEVPCAAKPLNRGDPLTPDSVTFARRNLASLRGEIWDGRGGPWQLVRAVGVGQVISTVDLSPLAMVRKGDIVTLIYERGPVRLEVKAESLAEGGPGDTIPVRNLQSKKQVYATVRSGGVVEVK